MRIDEPQYHKKIFDTPKATKFNYQLRVCTNLRGDSVVCIVGQVLLMTPSRSDPNKGIQKPLF